MIDQATRLRGLMQTRLTAAVERESIAIPSRQAASLARVIAVTSGKGGVGKTNIALNLAIALQRSEKRVCLMDANFGLANIDLLCGLNGYWNLSHVASGARRLADVILQGPEGVHVLSGAGGLTELRDRAPHFQAGMLRELQQLEENHDVIVMDTGTGVHHSVRAFVSASDVAVLVTTPEPTAIADTYATIKALSTNPPPVMLVVINQAASAAQSETIIDRLQRTAKMFLGAEVFAGGWIPSDPSLPAAVVHRTPLMLDSPHSASAAAITKLAQRVSAVSNNHAPRGRFFCRLSGQPHETVTT